MEHCPLQKLTAQAVELGQTDCVRLADNFKATRKGTGTCAAHDLGVDVTAVEFHALIFLAHFAAVASRTTQSGNATFRCGVGFKIRLHSAYTEWQSQIIKWQIHK